MISPSADDSTETTEACFARLQKHETIAILLFDQNPLWFGLAAELALRLDGPSRTVRLFLNTDLSSRRARRSFGPGRARATIDGFLDAAGIGKVSSRIQRALTSTGRFAERNHYPFRELHTARDGLVATIRSGLQPIESESGSSVAPPDHSRRRVAVDSSMMDWFRTGFPRTLVPPTLADAVDDLYANAYARAHAILSATSPDCVLIPNGRLVQEAAALEAANNLHVEAYCFETLHAFSDRILISTGDFSDPRRWAEAIRQHWNAKAISDEEASSISDSWYAERRVSIAANPYLVTNAGRLLEEHSGRYTAIFAPTTAAEVLRDAGGVSSPHGQFEALQTAIDVVRSNAAWNLIVRMHPNSARQHSHDRNMLAAIRSSDRIRVIAPEERVDIYALMRRADLVLSYGSTVGIEAVQMGVVSVSPIPTIFTELGAVHHKSIDAELLLALSEGGLVPSESSKRASAMYGYHEATAGLPMMHFKNSLNSRYVGTTWIDRWTVPRAVRGRLLA